MYCVDEIFRKIGLVKVRRLIKELVWFLSQGYVIFEVGLVGIVDVNYLMDLFQINVFVFISYFYNVCYVLLVGD